MIRIENSFPRALLVATLLCVFGFGAAMSGGIGPGRLDDDSPIIDMWDLEHSGDIDPAGAGFRITFDRPVAATYESEIGGVVLDVNGAPVRKTDGTYPAGVANAQGYGWQFDGAADYLSITDAASGGVFDPAGNFSVMAFVTPDTVAAGEDCILGKWETTGNQRSWKLCRDAATVVLSLSADGTAITTLVKATLAQGRPACIVATYDKAATTAAIYVNELTAATSAAMSAAIFDSTAPFEIGASDTGATLWDGRIDHVEYADGIVWSEATARQKCRQYRGLISAATIPVGPVSATPPAILVAPPASGTEPFLVPMPVNATQVSSPAVGRGGLYGASALTNIAQRSSLETWAAGVPTGWTEGITSTGDCAQGTTRMAHGFSSARCTLADADDAVTLVSACLTVTGATAYRLSAWARLESGTGLLDLVLIEDDSTDCATPTTTTSVVDDAVPTGDWARHSGTITTQAGTIRAQVRVSLPPAAAQVLDVDAIMLRTPVLAADHYCGTDADTSATCGALTLPKPSALRNHFNGETQIEFVASSPWAGVDLAGQALLFTDGAAAPNFLRITVDAVSDELLWAVFDSASGVKYNNNNVLNWAANTDYQLKVRFDGRNNGANRNLWLWWNSTWITATAGAGTGMRSAGQATSYLCGTASDGSGCYIRKLIIRNRFVD